MARRMDLSMQPALSTARRRVARADWGFFKLTPNSDGTWTESVLHSFKTSSASMTEGGLIFDKAGNLYGATNGEYYSSCCGLVYELDSATGRKLAE